MNRPYTEQDIVFKGETINEVISTYLETLDKDSREGVRNELSKILRKAEREHKPVASASQDIEGRFDAPGHQYLLIRRGAYNAPNLLFILFDILVEHPEGNPEEIEAETFEAIDRYIGEIEGREGMNFLGQRENLKQIAREMIHTLAMLEEEDFPEAELEKVSEGIDKNYYEPLAMILQSILIEIEKAPGV